MPITADTAVRNLAVLKLRAERRTVAEIAESTGYTRRHVKRILASAAKEYSERFGHRAA